MTTLVFDIETNGLLPDVNTLHCIVTQDVETGEVRAYHDSATIKPCAGSLQEGIDALVAADLLVGHNIQGYDIPVLLHLEDVQITVPLWDTTIQSKVEFPDMRERDFRRRRKMQSQGKEWIPGHLIGRHSLEAWGHRLGEHKGSYAKTTDWQTFTQEMLDYCIQDVRVNMILYQYLKARPTPEAARSWEQRFAEILNVAEYHGVLIDQDALDALIAELQDEQAKIDEQLAEMMPDFTDVYFTPKKKLRRTRTTKFNPGSRDHIARYLKETHGWKPTAFTPGGKPKIDETVLKGLPHPEARLIERRLLLSKRLGQVAEGKKAWVKCIRPDGRIHGRIDHIGTVTFRCAHKDPNNGQVPAVHAPFGKQCRGVWTVPEGFKLIGADASGLELRGLAHYLGRWDGGAYRDIILEGDIHTANMIAGEIEPRPKSASQDPRDLAKRCFYAWLYGAGDAKLGKILGGGPALGKQLRQRWENRIAGMRPLIDLLEARVNEHGFLIGLDKRRVPVRSMHAALNTLLQSFGAIVMKVATVRLDEILREEHGLIRPVVGWNRSDYDFCMVLHVHDEFQIEARAQYAQLVSLAAVEAIRDAGRILGLRCPLDGEARIGDSWAETH